MSNFTDKDKGFKKLMSTFQVEAGETAVFVGLLRSSGEYKPKESGKGTGSAQKQPQAITVAQVAAIHEFGSEDGRIPERSFIRSAMSDHSKQLNRLIKKVSNKIVDGKMNKKQALGIIGQVMTDWIKAKIGESVPPPNAPSTVKAKGSSHTLVDTGQMLNSIDWEIRTGKK